MFLNNVTEQSMCIISH